MFERIYVSEFFKNPFFWWSVSILFLTTFHSFEPFFRVLEVILLQKLYEPILFGCVSLAIFLILYPIRSELRVLLIQKNTQKEVIVAYSLIILVIVTHTVYFWSDPSMILTKIQPQIVVDGIKLKEALELKLLFEYIAMPLFYAIAMTQVKKMMLKHNKTKLDSIRNNWKFGILIGMTGAGTYYLHVFLTELL